MSEQDIEVLYDFDQKWFRSRRRFINHTQDMPTDGIEDEDGREQSSLIRKFSTFSAHLDESGLGGRYGWVEQIENRLLLDKLRQLSQKDLELLTLLAIYGYSQSDIARMQGCARNTVSKKITRIKKLLI